MNLTGIFIAIPKCGLLGEFDQMFKMKNGRDGYPEKDEHPDSSVVPFDLERTSRE